MYDRKKGLNEEEKKKVFAWLELGDKLSVDSVGCSICGQSKWKVGSHVVTPRVYDIPHEGDCFPMVMLICIKCGVTLSINAIHLGIIPEGDDLKL